jgi:hypothetical protein
VAAVAAAAGRAAAPVAQRHALRALRATVELCAAVGDQARAALQATELTAGYETQVAAAAAVAFALLLLLLLVCELMLYTRRWCESTHWPQRKACCIDVSYASLTALMLCVRPRTRKKPFTRLCRQTSSQSDAREPQPCPRTLTLTLTFPLKRSARRWC